MGNVHREHGERPDPVGADPVHRDRSGKTNRGDPPRRMPYGSKKSGDGSSGSCAEILIGGVFGLGAEAIVEGVRDVEDDLGVFLGGFESDGAVGVEELVGDVGKDRGAAWGDTAFGDEGEEAAEELADVGAGGELGEFGEEVGGEVFRVVLEWDGSGIGETVGRVAAAKARVS
jgi:hypothetical protein